MGLLYYLAHKLEQTLDANSHKITNLADGSSSGDAVNKGQLDGVSGVTYGTPALTLGTANSSGSTSEAIKRDSTILAFDATAPSTQAFGDTAAAGSATVAARRDHKHAMPATPVTSINKTGASALTGAVTLTGGTNVTLTQSGQDISIAASGASSTSWSVLTDGVVAGPALVFAGGDVIMVQS